MTFREDAHQARTGNGPAVAVVLRNTAIGYHRSNGEPNIARATRRANRRPNDLLAPGDHPARAAGLAAGQTCQVPGVRYPPEQPAGGGHQASAEIGRAAGRNRGNMAPVYPPKTTVSDRQSVAIDDEVRTTFVQLSANNRRSMINRGWLRLVTRGRGFRSRGRHGGPALLLGRTSA